MRLLKQRGSATRARGIGIAVVGLLAAAFGSWLVLGPGPMDFASGKRGAPGSSSGGVPAELTSASLIHRGEYLTRAADCVACHTSDGGQPFVGGRPFVLPCGAGGAADSAPGGGAGGGGGAGAQF